MQANRSETRWPGRAARTSALVRRAGRAMLILVESVRLVVGALRGDAGVALSAARRRAGRDDGREADPSRGLGAGLTGLPVGLWAWALVGLALPVALRNLAYPFTHSSPEDYRLAWGGPTLLGAWSVHALLVAPMIGVLVVLLSGLAGLHGVLLDRAVGRGPNAWPLLGVGVLTLPLLAAGFAMAHRM